MPNGLALAAVLFNATKVPAERLNDTGDTTGVEGAFLQPK